MPVKKKSNALTAVNPQTMSVGKFGTRPVLKYVTRSKRMQEKSTNKLDLIKTLKFYALKTQL